MAHPVALPDFPWDALAPHAEHARAHPGGIVDLAMGSPVDPVPEFVADALVGAGTSPGYPPTAGTPTLVAAIRGYLRRRCGVHSDIAVLPTIGSKELVATLPTLLGLDNADSVALPELAYPTYEVGAALAGAQPVRVPLGATPAKPPSLMWINSPANPTGQVLAVDELREVVTWARAHEVLLVSDECYLEFGWDAQPVSVLDARVSGGSFDGLLAVQSLSKRSNMASYRAAFVAGDPRVVAQLLAVRKHAGLIVPSPVQAAMVAALADDQHVHEQRHRYATRRVALTSALTAAGFTIRESAAGLYLWVTRRQDCWRTVADLADLGVLVSPGSFYGPAGAEFVRVSLTASDDRVATAIARLSSDR